MAKTSKQHYEQTASIMRDVKARLLAASPDAFITMVALFAVAYQSDNPRFDSERFLNACGVGT